METSKKSYTSGCVTRLLHPEPLPCGRPLPARTSAEDSNTGLAQSLWGLCVLGHTRLSLSPLSMSGGFNSIQVLSHVQLFVTPWTAAFQASLSITNSQSLLKLMSIESVMVSTTSSDIHPFSHLQSSPASGSFPRSQFLASGCQSIGDSASASVLSMSIQV